MHCPRCNQEVSPGRLWWPPKGLNPKIRRYQCSGCKHDFYALPNKRDTISRSLLTAYLNITSTREYQSHSKQSLSGRLGR